MPPRDSMLLHVCCAPCSTHVIDSLRKDYNVTCFFYNPNIYPKEEYSRRLDEMRRYASRVGMKLVAGDYDSERWLSLTIHLKDEKEGGKRCDLCYEIRLEETAKFASKHDFGRFATTLTISPHKRADIINRLGNELTKTHNVVFLGADFKKKNGFKRSVEMSKDENMYRQDYCGCIYSKLERESKKTG